MAAKSNIFKGFCKRMLFGLNSIAAVILALAMFGIVNYISYRHHTRADISRAQFYSLSEKTEAVLGSVSNRIDVLVYVQPGRTGYDDIVNLLDEYSARQPLIRVTRIDPDRDLAVSEQIAKQYGVENINLIIFDMGGRSRVVEEDDLFVLDKSPLERGEMPNKNLFNGEQVFTSALQGIVSGQRPKVYFLQGHGEGDPTDFDPKSGFSKCAAALENNNIEVAKFTPGEVRAIPDDCDALIVAGPSKRLADQEIDLLRDYLDANGKMIIMLESMRDVGLAPLLKDWGVMAGNDIVIDRTRTISGRELFITEYRRHPITAGLTGKSSIMYLPRSVEPLQIRSSEQSSSDRPHVTVLATCSSKGWGETDWLETPMEFNPERDRGGALGVAAAIERGLSSNRDVKVGSTQIVVFGDSDFVSNAGMAGANIDFFLAGVDWMLEREDEIAVGPKAFGRSRLILSRRQILALGLILVVGIPLLVAIAGGVVWLFRRC